MHEGDEPDAVAHLGDTDLLPGKDVTKVDLATVEAEASAVGHHEPKVAVTQNFGHAGAPKVMPRVHRRA